MVISDGTTDVEIQNMYVREQDGSEIDKSTRRAAGGDLKSQTSGERVALAVAARVTQAQYESIKALLRNDADDYFYTPKYDYTARYPSLATPFKANIRDFARTDDNIDYYYVEFTAEAVSYQ